MAYQSVNLIDVALDKNWCKPTCYREDSIANVFLDVVNFLLAFVLAEAVDVQNSHLFHYCALSGLTSTWVM